MESGNIYVLLTGHKDKSGYNENKMLASIGLLKCSACKCIKPIEKYKYVNEKKSKRMRKQCDDCRKDKLRKRYYARKAEKLKAAEKNG